MKFWFPSIFAIDFRWRGNSIHQLIQPRFSSEVFTQDYTKGQVKGYIVTPTDDPESHIWAATNGSKPPFECDKALRVRSNHLMGSEALLGDAMSATWLRHPLLSEFPSNPIDFGIRINEVITSWHNAFSYVEEDAANQTQGLRGPQIGAVHATHAHWSVSDQIGTIVMPTGTGKTETMLSLSS